MKPGAVAVIGAAETTDLGKIPNLTTLGLNADAALNTLADCGLRPSDIDGVAAANPSPVEVAWYLGITPKWVDGTSVGGKKTSSQSSHRWMRSSPLVVPSQKSADSGVGVGTGRDGVGLTSCVGQGVCPSGFARRQMRSHFERSVRPMSFMSSTRSRSSVALVSKTGIWRR